MKEESLVKAIVHSGYPLQGVVADILNSEFVIIEEWGYVDADTHKNRSLDLHAWKNLAVEANQSLQPGLLLLIECKRTISPVILFQQVVERVVPDFPVIVGAPSDTIFIDGPESGKGISTKLPNALGLLEEPFVRTPANCASLTKARAKGSKVELSGDETFNSIILPLGKALLHSEAIRSKPRIADRLFPVMTLCVAVIDGPMVLVESPSQASDPVMTPWARVVRHESTRDRTGIAKSQFFAFDVVHADYFNIYLHDHVMPFATTFAERIVMQEDVLRYGGRLSTLDQWAWSDVTPKPKAKT